MRRQLTSIAVAVGLGASFLSAASVGASAAPPPKCEFNGKTPAHGATVSGNMVLEAVEHWDDTTSTEFFVDGKSIGFSAQSRPDWIRQYSRPGTVAGGYRTTARANGTHTISCRNFGPDGPGPMSATRTVKFNNSVRNVMTWPQDGAQVDGTKGAPGITLKVRTSVTGTTQPTQARFFVDGVQVATAPCKAGVCETTWQPATSKRRFPFEDHVTEDGTRIENPKGGLRILHAEVTAGNGKVASTAPTRVFVNRSDTSSKLVLSDFEAAGHGRVGRDGGYSAKIPGTNKTLFVMNDAKWVYNTGAKQGTQEGQPGPYLATAPIKVGHPGMLTQTPNSTGHIAPAPKSASIKVTEGLTDPQGGTCDGSLTWATGVTQSPTSSTKMLLTYTAICGEDAADGTAQPQRQVEGVAEYDVATDTATMKNIIVAAPGKELAKKARLETPVRHGDHLYFYSADEGATYAARVPAAQWKTPSAYRWYANGSFTATSAADATSIGSGTSTQLSIEKYPNLTGSPYLKITQPTWQTVTIESSASPSGPWKATNVTNRKICPECQDAEGFVYTVYGHPELSAADKVLLTFTDHAEYSILSKEIAVTP